jgi:iron complex transport system ATP-binding protein
MASTPDTLTAAPAGLPLSARFEAAGYGGKPILEDVAFMAEPGAFVGIIGPNGSGKSTLLRVLSGELVPDGEGVTLGTQPLSAYPRRTIASRIAVVPQWIRPVFGFSVREVVELGCHPHIGRWRGPRAEDFEAVDQALDRTGLTLLQERAVNTLSGGELQRVFLARALAQRGAVYLLDEPTAHLDPGHQYELFQLMRDEAGAGHTVICVSHDLNLAATFCDHLYLLNQGRIVASGPPGEVFNESTLHPLYGDTLTVIPHPLHNGPLIITRGAADR